MKALLEKCIPEYQAHADLFEELGTQGYTVALNVRNVTPELYFSTFPQAWIDRYLSQSFAMADPVVDFMVTDSGTTRWSAISSTRGPEKTAQFLEVSAAEGLKFGAAVVTRSHVEPSVKSLVSVCRSDRELTDQELLDLEASVLKMVAKVEGSDHLSVRQLSILGLMAGGSTRQECARALSVSSDTVKRDAELARHLLGARNTTEAVAIATARKLIPVSGSQGW